MIIPLRQTLLGPLLACVLFLVAGTCAGQRVGVLTLGAGNTTLWGDLKVDETEAVNPRSNTYTIVLYTPSRAIIGKQTISNGGRYRFLDLADGEYDVAVEVNNAEVTRLHVVLASQPNVGKTDIRRDIELEWHANRVGGNSSKSSTISAEDFYRRPETNERLFSKAQQATNEKKYDLAVANLRQIIENDPRDFQAWTELGTVYLLQSAFDDAEKAYLSAIDNRPSFFLALLDLGRLYLAQKKFEPAVDVLLRAVKTKPQSAEANYYLGESYLQIRKGSLAVGYLNEAIRLDPEGMAEAHLRLALLYNGAGLKDKAAVEYAKFLKKKPNYPDRKKLEKYIAENKKQ